MHPTLKGAVFVYDNFLRGFLTKYEKEIDSRMAEYSKAAQNFSKDVTKRAMEEAQKNPEVLAAAAQAGAQAMQSSQGAQSEDDKKDQ